MAARATPRRHSRAFDMFPLRQENFSWAALSSDEHIVYLTLIQTRFTQVGHSYFNAYGRYILSAALILGLMTNSGEHI